uniref:DUF342 domain-containing protein n=1 Tax=Thaumasiovibrio occultus TaxID=1891184 RepID=UPI000B34D133|nr:FapA family protein [Thaumasiovibrio occultus]
MTQQLIVISQDQLSVFFQPGAYQAQEHGELTVAGVIALLDALEVSDYFIHQDVLRSTLASLAATNPPTSPVVIAVRRDASLTLKISDDAMVVYASVEGGYGGELITERDFKLAIAEHKISHGIDSKAIDQLLLRARQLAAGETVSDVIAKGVYPVEGKDAKIIPLVKDHRARIIQPQELDNGKVDMRDLGALIVVRAQQALMQRTEPTKGVAGITVLGRAIEPKPGKDKTMVAGKGTEFSPTDPNLLISIQAGIPNVKPNSVIVDEALCLDAVDVSTGHINFDGSVVVNGDVAQGMHLSASGSITIGGVVESARIEAGGNITVANGIIGKQSEVHACRVEAKGDIACKFSQYAHLIAKANIHVALHALHCEMISGGDIVVADQSGKKGTLNGGVCRAGGKVDVTILGATAAAHTQVFSFEKLAQVKEGRQSLVDKRQASLDAIEKIMTALRQNPIDKLQSGAAQKLKQAMLEHQRQVATIDRKLLQFTDLLNGAFRKHAIFARKRVYAGVKCEIGGEALALNEEHGPSCVRYDGNKVTITPI